MLVGAYLGILGVLGLVRVVVLGFIQEGGGDQFIFDLARVGDSGFVVVFVGSQGIGGVGKVVILGLVGRGLEGFGLEGLGV